MRDPIGRRFWLTIKSSRASIEPMCEPKCTPDHTFMPSAAGIESRVTAMKLTSTDFLRLHPYLSIGNATMFSNTAITVESAANDMNRKKNDPTTRPATGPIALNTFGSETNARPAPEEGSTPKAAQAGKMMSPAAMATKVSSPITRRASPLRELSFPMYEPKISMEPMPSDSVKNACPIAA